jgi:8-amino-7-oxononanoate synthase
MSGLDAFCQQKLDALRAKAQFRELKTPHASRISFCNNDYLGLSADARVIAAGRDALEKYGAGARASRLVEGSSEAYAALEAALAKAKGAEAALVFGSGYLANIGVVPALVGRGDLILADRLVHACMLDGARLSGADVMRFSHNSMEHLHTLLRDERPNYARCLILTETIFSMDGDRAPIETICGFANAHHAWVLSDDAHGLYQPNPESRIPNHVQLGTLSKALGSYGGYVAGSRVLIDYLVNTARSLIFSTGLPPAVGASAHAALEIAHAEPWRAEKALSNAQLFCSLMGLKAAESQIVPVILEENEKALAAAQTLADAGFSVAAIRPPTVPANTARLRFAFTAEHTTEDVQRLAGAIHSR